MVTIMMSCDDHDYIEIVCTFRYPIQLTLRSGETLHAVGLTTRYNSEKKECLEIEQAGHRSLIVLDDIAGLNVGVDNPHFQSVTFGDD